MPLRPFAAFPEKEHQQDERLQKSDDAGKDHKRDAPGVTREKLQTGGGVVPEKAGEFETGKGQEPCGDLGDPHYVRDVDHHVRAGGRDRAGQAKPNQRGQQRERRNGCTSDEPEGPRGSIGPASRGSRHEDCSDEREHQREREVQLIDPEQTEPHAGERDTVWQHADRQPRQQLERADEEHDAAGEDVGRIDNVRGEIQRPRSEEDPGPEEPTRHLRISAPDVPREQRQRGGRQQVEEDVGRFGYRQQPQRSAHEESYECARDARPGIHDVGAKPGPLTGRVVTQTDQIDLQFIVCPELVGQAKG